MLVRARALLAIGSAHHVLSAFEAAKIALEEARAIFERADAEAGLSDALHKLAALNYDRGLSREALQLATRALRTRQRLNDDQRLADTLIVIAQIHHRDGDQAKALRYAMRSLDHAIAIKNAGREAIALQTMGAVYSDTDMPAEALEQYERSLQCYGAVGDKAGEAGCLYRIGQLQYRKGDLAAARQRLEEALGRYDDLGEKLGSVIVLNQLVAVHLESNELAAAEKASNTALARTNDLGQSGAVVDALGNAADIAVRRGDHAAALNHLHNGLQQARSSEYLPGISRLTGILQDVYEALGDYEAALKLARESATLRVELTRRENANEVRIFKTKAELAAARSESERLKHESERLRLSVEHQTRELSSMALHLIERKSFLEELRRTLSAASTPTDNRGGADRGPRTSELERNIRLAIKKIAEKIDSEGDFQAFDDQLNIVHDDFLQLLARQFPQLTSTERKVCVLLRLDLSTKDIAGILHISPLTVNTHRRRIRSKLGLRRTSLISFLLALT